VQRITLELLTGATIAIADLSCWITLQLLRALSRTRRACSRRTRRTPTSGR
jgi:hypothetical protein